MRGKRDRCVDLPKNILAALDEVAAYQGVTLKQLTATWLWDKAQRQASNPDLPDHIRERLRKLTHPYGAQAGQVRPYPRRQAGS